MKPSEEIKDKYSVAIREETAEAPINSIMRRIREEEMIPARRKTAADSQFSVYIIPCTALSR